MKTKKLLSLVSAAAISASCFAGMAVTASAAEVNLASFNGQSFQSGEQIASNEDFNIYASTRNSEGNTVTGNSSGLKATNAYKPTVNGAQMRAALAIETKKSGTLSVIVNIGYTKTVRMIEADFSTGAIWSDNDTASYKNETGSSEDYVLSATVEANKTYVVGGAGTDPTWKNILFIPSSEPEIPSEEPSIPPAVEESTDWINNSKGTDGITATTDEDGAYVLTYAQGVESGQGFSYDLLANMTNKPEDITNANGTITVTFDTYVESVSGDFTYELNGETAVAGWNPGNGSQAMYARLAGNAGWQTMRYIAGNNSTLNQYYDNANKVTGTWIPVTMTLDLGRKTVSMSYNNDVQSATGTTNAAWVKYPNGKLYLNVQPSMSKNENADTVVKVRNITSSYTEYAPVASTVEVSDVEVFDNSDKTSKATVFNATVHANDFAVTGLKFENNDVKKETTEIAQGSTALFVVVYEGLATANPVVTPIN